MLVAIGQRWVTWSVPDLYRVTQGPGMIVRDALMMIICEPQFGVDRR